MQIALYKTFKLINLKIINCFKIYLFIFAIIVADVCLNTKGFNMRVEKTNSNPAFGAKLTLCGVNKKHWNLSVNELKQLALKAEEIGTPKDEVLFRIGKFGTFNNAKKMLADDSLNVEGPLYGSYRDIKGVFTVGGKSQQVQLANYAEGDINTLKHPFKIMKNWLNVLSEHFPNELRAKHKTEETSRLIKFIDNYDSNAKNVSDYLFADKSIDKVAKHIDDLKGIKVAVAEHMINHEALSKKQDKKFGSILCGGFITIPAYVKGLISRSHLLSAKRYLNIRKNPGEYTKLQAKEEALLAMFKDK